MLLNHFHLVCHFGRNGVRRETLLSNVLHCEEALFVIVSTAGIQHLLQNVSRVVLAGSGSSGSMFQVRIKRKEDENEGTVRAPLEGTKGDGSG